MAGPGRGASGNSDSEYFFGLFYRRTQHTQGPDATMSLHPDYPIITGSDQMTDEWTLLLPEKFNRRFEDGSLVVWRPELTFWITIWGNDRGQSADERLASILETANDLRSEQQIDRSTGLVRLTYELPEKDASRRKPVYTSISGYVIGPTGHVQMSAYFDTPKARALGYEVIHSVQTP